jgi:hypothetical protein
MISLDELSIQVRVVARDSSGTVLLNTQVVSVHVHEEETVFAPVGAPWVTANPVFLALFGNTVPDHWDFVVDWDRVEMFGVDAARVSVVKSISCLDTAGDRTKLGKLRLHLIGSDHWVVLADVVLLVGYGSAVCGRIFTSFRNRWRAISAQVEIGALTALKVVSSILLARAVGDSVLVSVLVNLSGVATIAATSSLAIDDSLGVKTDWGGVLQLIQDVESVSDGAGSALSPAWAAVARNVLILVPGHVVTTVHISPVNDLG